MGISSLTPGATVRVCWGQLRVRQAGSAFQEGTQESGRKSLYVNPVRFLRFVELPQEEGDALAEELFERMVQPGGEYRHKWNRHDYVIWDNRCLIHAATGDYPIDEKRIHWRATIMEASH